MYKLYFNTLYRASFITLYNDQRIHNYFTNYNTPICFDTIVSSSGKLYSIPGQVTKVYQMQLLAIQFAINTLIIGTDYKYNVSVNNTTPYFIYNKNSVLSGRHVSTFIRSSSGPLGKQIQKLSIFQCIVGSQMLTDCVIRMRNT